MEGDLVLRSSDDDLAATVELPPGFRFHPTDEEIIMHYLLNKLIDRQFRARAIAEADLNKCEPWDLPNKGKMGEKEWFFYCQRDRKYPTGMRTNRATESGYWKATGKDKEIYCKSKKWVVGMKKTLVFYKGRAPKGQKTNWVMHEYRLHEANYYNISISRASKEEFVVCRVFHKNSGIRKTPSGLELAGIDSFVDHLLDSPTLPPLTDYNCSNTNEGPCPNFYTPDQDEWKGHIINSSSRAFLSNHKLQYLQYDPKNFFLPQNTNNPFSSPHNTLPNPNFYPQTALPTSVISYEAQTSVGYPNHGLGSMISSYPTNAYPFKRIDRENLRVIAPKTEHFSSNNSVISHSQETGLSTENMASELRSKGDVESRINKPFDDHELEGLGDISDLDSLWSY